MNLVIDGFIFIVGLCFGSFLNVCIHRMPRGESIVNPPSHCPGCIKSIAWYDNIPVLSFLILMGKCRYCGTRISSRYFFVELASGALWLSLWFMYGFSWVFAAGVVLLSILLAVSVIDLETGLIPDKFTFPGMTIGLILSAVSPQLHDQILWYRGLTHSAIGLLAGGGILFAIGMLGNFLFRKESMGGGDVKLLAMLGAFLGWKKVILIFLFSPLTALPFALYAKFVEKGETIPFGPFLAVTGAWMFIYGDKISEIFFYF